MAEHSARETTRTIIPARLHKKGSEVLGSVAADRVYIRARVVLRRIPTLFI